jgi:hypothetical protein
MGQRRHRSAAPDTVESWHRFGQAQTTEVQPVSLQVLAARDVQLPQGSTVHAGTCRTFEQVMIRFRQAARCVGRYCAKRIQLLAMRRVQRQRSRPQGKYRARSHRSATATLPIDFMLWSNVARTESRSTSYDRV